MRQCLSTLVACWRGGLAGLKQTIGSLVFLLFLFVMFYPAASFIEFIAVMVNPTEALITSLQNLLVTMFFFMLGTVLAVRMVHTGHLSLTTVFEAEVHRQLRKRLSQATEGEIVLHRDPHLELPRSLPVGNEH